MSRDAQRERRAVRRRDALRRLRLSLGGALGLLLLATGSVARARRRMVSEGAVLCISFHNPPPSQFERCVAWLARCGFSFLSLEQVLEVARTGRSRGGGCVWVTLDDGWRGNLRLLPAVERHRVPVTIFVSTEACETSGVFWWTVARRRRDALPSPFCDSPERLWQVPETQRKRVVDPLLKAAREHDRREALKPSEISWLSRHPLVTFGSHTVAHPNLLRCDEEQLASEVGASRQRIEEWTGAPVRAFAYPRGSFGAREVDAVSREGYEVAATTRSARYRPGTDSPFTVPRVELGDDSATAANVAKMVGLWRPLTGWARILRQRVGT